MNSELPRRLLLGASIFFAAQGCTGEQSALEPHGPQAQRIFDLWTHFLTLGTAVYLVTIAVLLAGLFLPGRYWGSTIHAEQTAMRLVRVSVGVTVIILTGLLVESFRTGRDMSAFSAKDPVKIQITGHQWWWEIEYEDPDVSRRFKTANEFHIPVGEPIRVSLRSSDVIHSLWIPNLHGKTDLIPSYENTTWLQADDAGVYRGQCAEFCGHQHAHMGMYVFGDNRKDYEDWLVRQRAPSDPPSNPAALRGRETFVRTQCAMCHSIRGTTAGSQAGPDLTHLMSRTTIAAGLLPTNRQNLSRWITDPQSIKPGAKMPASEMQQPELADLLTYLETLK